MKIYIVYSSQETFHCLKFQFLQERNKIFSEFLIRPKHKIP